MHVYYFGDLSPKSGQLEASVQLDRQILNLITGIRVSKTYTIN